MSEPRRRKPARAEPKASAEADLDDTRWWVIVTSINEIVGSGRYGVWDTKPKSQHVEGILHIWNKADEPELYVGMGNSVTATIGQSKHFDARPLEKKAPDDEQ